MVRIDSSLAEYAHLVDLIPMTVCVEATSLAQYRCHFWTYSKYSIEMQLTASIREREREREEWHNSNACQTDKLRKSIKYHYLVHCSAFCIHTHIFTLSYMPTHTHSHTTEFVLLL